MFANVYTVFSRICESTCVPTVSIPIPASPVRKSSPYTTFGAAMNPESTREGVSKPDGDAAAVRSRVPRQASGGEAEGCQDPRTPPGCRPMAGASTSRRRCRVWRRGYCSCTARRQSWRSPAAVRRRRHASTIATVVAPMQIVAGRKDGGDEQVHGKRAQGAVVANVPGQEAAAVRRDAVSRNRRADQGKRRRRCTRQRCKTRTGRRLRTRRDAAPPKSAPGRRRTRRARRARPQALAAESEAEDRTTRN